MEIELTKDNLKTKEDYKRYKMYLHELMLEKQRLIGGSISNGKQITGQMNIFDFMEGEEDG